MKEWSKKAQLIIAKLQNGGIVPMSKLAEKVLRNEINRRKCKTKKENK
jgi:hypothetical protein